MKSETIDLMRQFISEVVNCVGLVQYGPIEAMDPNAFLKLRQAALELSDQLMQENAE